MLSVLVQGLSPACKKNGAELTRNLHVVLLIRNPHTQCQYGDQTLCIPYLLSSSERLVGLLWKLPDMALAWLQIQQLLFSGSPIAKGEKEMPLERTFKV